MASKNEATYTVKEVSQHNTFDDCWIIINNSVYDVTKWLPRHPGGDILIGNLAGKNCTDEFKIFHYEPNYKLLKMFKIGEVVKEEWKYPSELSRDVQLLHDDLKKKGAFKPDYFFYAQRFTIIFTLFGLSVAFLTSSSSLMSAVVAGVCLGFFWQQLAFIGHDLGHHVLTHDFKTDNNIAVFVGNMLQGISLAWWKHSHNTHHTITNSITYDPDIQHLPFLAVSREFFSSLYSLYHMRILKFDAFASFFVSIQHYMFYPIMSLARFNLYAQSFIHNIAGPGSRNKKDQRAELISLGLFWLWYIALCTMAGTWSRALIFFFLSHAVAGIVHVQICISHFSMETYDGIPQAAFDSDGYIKSQLTTTANIDCYPFMDFFHGGLQFQVEHHLFPHLTRSMLRYAHGEVRKLCKKHNLPHYNKTFFTANYDVLATLYETSKQLKVSSMFHDGLNLVG